MLSGNYFILGVIQYSQIWCFLVILQNMTTKTKEYWLQCTAPLSTNSNSNSLSTHSQSKDRRYHVITPGPRRKFYCYSYYTGEKTSTQKYLTRRIASKGKVWNHFFPFPRRALNPPKRLYPIPVPAFLVALVLETDSCVFQVTPKMTLTFKSPASTSEKLGLKMYAPLLVLAGAGARTLHCVWYMLSTHSSN